LGLKPNQVSVSSVLFAAGSATCLLFLAREGASPWLWIAAAGGIQLRLLCNLMDGMLAVEGGLKTPDGDLFNEFPDRLADPLILVSLGYAAGDETSRLLGWCCGLGALLTACVRLHGASLLGVHDFRGPMAKPHRMALATVACLLAGVLEGFESALRPLPWLLGLMLAGIGLTLFRRLRYLAAELRRRDPVNPPPT